MGLPSLTATVMPKKPRALAVQLLYALSYLSPYLLIALTTSHRLGAATLVDGREVGIKCHCAKPGLSSIGERDLGFCCPQRNAQLLPAIGQAVKCCICREHMSLVRPQQCGVRPW